MILFLSMQVVTSEKQLQFSNTSRPHDVFWSNQLSATLISENSSQNVLMCLDTEAYSIKRSEQNRSQKLVVYEQKLGRGTDNKWNLKLSSLDIFLYNFAFYSSSHTLHDMEVHVVYYTCLFYFQFLSLHVYPSFQLL